MGNELIEMTVIFFLDEKQNVSDFAMCPPQKFSDFHFMSYFHFLVTAQKFHLKQWIVIMAHYSEIITAGHRFVLFDETNSKLTFSSKNWFLLTKFFFFTLCMCQFLSCQ